MRLGLAIESVQRVITVFVVLGIVGFASWSIVSANSWFGPGKQVASLERKDDPVHNGFAILEAPRRAMNARVEQSQKSAVILLDNWEYTNKTQPSPFQ